MNYLKVFNLDYVINLYLKISTLETNSTVTSVPSNNIVANLMDIDDDLYGNTTTTNGVTNNGTVPHSTTQIPNGHSLVDDDDNNNNIILDKNINSNGCSTKIVDGMECDGNGDLSHTMDMETTVTDAQKQDEQLLLKILQFGRDLHTLKQQLSAEYGENSQNDKILQVNFPICSLTHEIFLFLSGCI